MERLTSVRAPKSGMVIHLIALGLLLLGPSVVAKVISGVTSAVTWPLTRELSFADNRFETFNTELVLIYLIAAIGLNLLMQTGLISIGHSAFFGLGAYFVAITTVDGGWSFWLALPVAGLVAGAVGAILAIPALRLGVFTLAMVTVGYAFVAEDLAIEWRTVTGGGDGFRGVQMPAPFDDLESYYWLVVIVVVVTYAVSHNLLRSPLGRGAKAVEESPVAAQSLGINLYGVKVTTFTMSAVLAGIAGGLYAPLLGFVAPDSFTVNLAILLLLMVLFGGSGTLAGPIVGAILLFRIPIEVERVTDQPGEWSLFVYGVVLLLSVHLFPRGLMSAWWWIRGRLTRRAPQEAQERARADVRSVVTTIERSEEAVLDARGVIKTLGAVRALDGLDLAVQAGTVHALIGPNGSGKTTFLNTISGYLHPDQGRVGLFGMEAGTRSPMRRARAGLGRTFQTPFVFPGMSCLENVLTALDRERRSSLVANLLRLPRMRREAREHYDHALAILESVGLAERAHESPANLPPGERRLLQVGRVVAIRPRLVLMDEPAAGLTGIEIDELEEVIRNLRAAGIAVLLVEHHVDFVLRLADEITVIDFGKVIAHGPPDEIRRDPVVLAAYLGEPTEELADAEGAHEADELLAVDNDVVATVGEPGTRGEPTT